MSSKNLRQRWAGGLLVAAVFCVMPLWAETPSFPPPPAAEDRLVKNDAERDAGVVILEAVTELTGEAKVGFPRLKGSVSRQFRVRYLVLDAKGVEQVARHAFFGERKTEIHDLRGRTLTAEGREYPLDPDKDIHNLDLRDPAGKPRGAVRSAIFPNVAPGAVLDLAWSEESNEVPDFEPVFLQSEFPIRERRLKVRGLLLKTSAGKAFLVGGPTSKFYWVPFFLGPVPPRAHATLDGEFNLDLEIRDVRPYTDDPYAPPFLRTGYVLGLLPKPVSVVNKSAAATDRRRGFVLFGPRGRDLMSGADASVVQDVDPGDAFVRLDGVALQAVPDWQGDKELLRWHQSVLHDVNKHFNKFFKRTGEGEGKDQVAAVAPPGLPWRERARRLFDYARSKVRPDPDAEVQKRLADLLRAGKGRGRDVTLYLSYLLDLAGIPARVVVPLNRFSPPFHPLVENFETFDISYLLEVGPPGETPLYLMPGSVFGNFQTVSDGYFGALAFRQPEQEDDDWPMVQILKDQSVSRKTDVAFSAALDPSQDEVRLRLRSTLFDTAASSFRWRFGWTAHKEDTPEAREARKKIFISWVDRWANLELADATPEFDPKADPEGPAVFEIVVPWKPEVQEMGDKLLLPALPRADLFHNVFRSEKRVLPIWLEAGEYKVGMTWQLPPGAALDQAPPPAEGKGPMGLEYRMSVEAKGTEPGLTTTMTVRLPAMIPASEYAGVRRFFEDLQRTADTRLLVRTGGAP